MIKISLWAVVTQQLNNRPICIYKKTGLCYDLLNTPPACGEELHYRVQISPVFYNLSVYLKHEVSDEDVDSGAVIAIQSFDSQ